MMKAEYVPIFKSAGVEIKGPTKVVNLPFSRTSARAIIVRRSDGEIVGALHSPEGKFALPGGDLEDGESPMQAVTREIEEENIHLRGSDDRWQDRMQVSYFDGYRELAFWFLFVVDDAKLGQCEETIEVRWISQGEDLWHPLMQKRILLVMERYVPELMNVGLMVH